MAQNEFCLSPETTPEEYETFIDGLIETAGEPVPNFPFRVLPRATVTSVFEKSFDVLMDNVKVPMQLIFLEGDVYVVSWNIPQPEPESPRYAIFSDHKDKFVKRAEAASVATISFAGGRRIGTIGTRARGRQRNRFIAGPPPRARRGAAAPPPPERDNLFLVAELAKAWTLPITGSYGDLIRLSTAREELNLNKYSLLNAFRCIYNAATEESDNRLAEGALKVLQMVPEPMRNARMKRVLVENFNTGGKVSKVIVDRQNKWGSSSKTLHGLPVDSSRLTPEERAANDALIQEWTLIKAKTLD